MQSVNSVWNKGFVELGGKYVQWFVDGKFQLEQLVKFPSLLEALHEVYLTLAKTGQLETIEELNAEDKNGLWNDCKPYIESLSTKDRIKFCKCYWALAYLTEKRNV